MLLHKGQFIRHDASITFPIESFFDMPGRDSFGPELAARVPPRRKAWRNIAEPGGISPSSWSQQSPPTVKSIPKPWRPIHTTIGRLLGHFAHQTQ